ncbi:DUF2066 domain-containing protein [Ectopseudomonas mendocina]|uniref:DUF2066 domain-containing protein n=1 Tax=Ectopseudomonas mendocina TaxID=300 RepID=A0ABZ2RI00_ECTME
MRFIDRLLVASLMLSGLPAVAAPVSDLYKVREPVASQQPEDRAAALTRALDTLVLRLTGKDDVAKNQALAELRKDPQQIISQYGYEEDKLTVDFDPTSTERALRQAGLQLWGNNRPVVMTWWLNASAEGTSLVGDAQLAAETLSQAAQNRGLPLRLPLADLSEQLVGTEENIASDDASALRAASERYSADALLSVLARESGGEWQAQWRLWQGDKREQGSVSGADQAAVADAVLLQVSKRLTSQFMATAGAASNLTLEVQGADLNRYAELQRVLEPYGAVLRLVQGDKLVFGVNANADQLRAQLALSHLQEVTAEAIDAAQAPTADGAVAPVAPAAPVPSNVLKFRW